MLYEHLIPFKVYTLSKLVLPKGIKSGFGNALFILSDSQKSTLNNLKSDYINFRPFFYKYYYIDAIYNDRIGPKRIIQNNKQKVKEEFKNSDVENLRFVEFSSKKTVLSKNPNVIVDLGEWLSLYFTYQRKVSLQSICENFISFLLSKINNDELYQYNKILYIDITNWFKRRKLKLSKEYAIDPLTIFMISLYKFPELFALLGDMDIIIADSEKRQFLKVNAKNDLTKDSYNTFKMRLRSFQRLSDMEDDEEKTENPIITRFSKDKEEIIKKNRIKIINSLKKNFVGEVEDLTEYIDEDNLILDDDIIKTESDYDDDIEFEANKYMDENPEILTSNPEEVVKEIQDYVKKKIYVAKFMPEKTEKEIKNIEKLKEKQKTVIGLPSFQDLESKVIPESEFTDYIQTSNVDILKSKFTNFDKAYNEKKLEKDIDESVGALENADFPIFIINKEEEDTSDQLNLKKTVTYTLEDEKGKTMKVKFDIPIIIEDNYVYINGSKKIIQHQLILKPLVKTGPDTVQIVGAYKKIFITRKGNVDLVSNSLKKYLTDNAQKFKVKFGNSVIKNKDYETSLEFDIIAKNIFEFTIGDIRIITNINYLKSELNEKNIPFNIKDDEIPIGFNKKTREVITIHQKDDYIETISKILAPDDKKELEKVKSGKRLMYAECTIMEKHFPLILFMLFSEGFKSVMEKSNIEYRFIAKDEKREINTIDYGLTELADGYIVWRRYPLQNSLLMNGLNNFPLHLYSIEELESKETYIFLLTQIFNYSNMAFNLDQYKNFMIDPITKEILMDYNLPTDLISLMAYATELLVDNSYLPENNTHNNRLRSNELIPLFIYNSIVDAYNNYRKTQHKKNPTKISIKQNAIISQLMKSKLVEDASILNPVLELEKNRSVTYKGERGINLEKAMTLPKRAYDESMLGVVGISTSPDANVGILRQLTLEPNITSTRGYIEPGDKKNVEKMSAANLLTPAELLTPFSLQHDDPTRTAIRFVC